MQNFLSISREMCQTLLLLTGSQEKNTPWLPSLHEIQEYDNSKLMQPFKTLPKHQNVESKECLACISLKFVILYSSPLSYQEFNPKCTA